jgi:hypothetical protein
MVRGNLRIGSDPLSFIAWAGRDANLGLSKSAIEMFQIDLPIGALVSINGHSCRHTGNGKFVSDEPIRLIEGVTKDGSDAARAWPGPTRHPGFFMIETVESDMDGPSHRNMAIGELSCRLVASNPNLGERVDGQAAID